MESIGKIAYDAYCRKSGGVSLVSGAQLPGWEALSPEIKGAWEFAAAALLSATGGISKLWYVGQVRSGEFPDVVWDFQGVFSAEALAVEACHGPQDFVSPIVLNEELPRETVEAPGYFPLAQRAAADAAVTWSDDIDEPPDARSGEREGETNGH